MGRRSSVYITSRTSFPGPPAPNATVDAITVDVRVFFPPNAPAGLLHELLTDAAAAAHSRIDAKFATGAR